MKQNWMKRFGALLLICALLVSCIPAPAIAAEPNNDIKAIERPTGITIVKNYDGYVGADWIDQLGLPKTVWLTLADDTKKEVVVTWDTESLDPDKAGFCFLTGTFTLPEGATNGQQLQAGITVQVVEKENLLYNGSFESGTLGIEGWGGGGSVSKNNDPAHITHGSYSVLRTLPTLSGMTYQLLYQSGHNKDPQGTAANYAAMLAEKVKDIGAGQYYVGLDVKSAEENLENAPSVHIYVQKKSVYNATTGTAVITTDKRTVRNDMFVTVSGVFDLDGTENWLRTDVIVTGQAGTLSAREMYLDNMEFFALKTELKVEPSSVSEVITKVQARSVVINYDQYVGENWQAALGLPETVEVRTDNGSVINLGVTWDFSGLDLHTYGQYVLKGTLDDSAYQNPKNLSVQQVIYIRRYTNLISNYSYEEGTVGWHAGSNTSAIDTDNHKDGNSSLRVTIRPALAATTKQTQAAYIYGSGESAQKELGGKIAAQGAGQYYYSAWAKLEQENLGKYGFYAAMLYKNPANPSTAVKTTSSTQQMSHTDWVQSYGVWDMPADTNWARLDLYIHSNNGNLGSQKMYLDYAELVPLNVLIPLGSEPADIIGVSAIPPRAVIKNYDRYVGENWQEALGLPEYVEVYTAKETTASVAVTWDYSNLNLYKTGKYVLTGKLDDSAYGNPNGFTVQQIIYIVDYKNLLSNSSFEDSGTDWAAGSNTYKQIKNPVVDGQFARAVTIKSGLATTTMHIQASYVSSTGEAAQKELGAKINYNGGGQYYFGVWAQFEGEDAENYRFRTNLLYRTTAEGSNTNIASPSVDITNTGYTNTGKIVELPAGVQWARMDLYLEGKSGNLSGKVVYYDKAELIPLNVTVIPYEGYMESLYDRVLQRNIVVNYPDYLGGAYTTKDLMLPETLRVVSSQGEIITVGVDWDYSPLNLYKTGTYVLTGTLQDMLIANPNGITVTQTIKVVPYENLLYNGSFENGSKGWSAGSNSCQTSIPSPRLHDTFSIRVKIRDNFDIATTTSIQAMYVGATSQQEALGASIMAAGGGRYYFGGWGQADAKTDNLSFEVDFLYKSAANGNSSIKTMAPIAQLSKTEFSFSGGILEIPDDTTWARLDFVVKGANSAALSGKEIYFDKAELIPLNVEVSMLSDLIYVAEPVDAYVHQGTAFEELGLEGSLRVQTKTGVYTELGVTWNQDEYDPNKVGTQTIHGTLNLGSKFTNPNGFVPKVTIIVREKGEDLRQTIYFSTSGDDANDGLSPETPKKDVTKAGTYLAQGYNVRLKRGDTWYLPTGSIKIAGAYGTEKAPLTFGAYGDESQDQPTLAFMKSFADTEWELVDAKRNVWKADVSSFPVYQGRRVKRTIVDGVAYFPKDRSNYVSLEEEEFCDYDGYVYIRMPEGQTPHNVEAIPCSNAMPNRIRVDAASYFNVEHLNFKGGSSTNHFFWVEAPTKYMKIQYCNWTYTSYYLLLVNASNEQVHYKMEVSNNFADAMLSVKEGAYNEDGIWDVSQNEGFVFRHGVIEAWIHHNHLRNMSHCAINLENVHRDTMPNIKGIHYCVVEDNLIEGVNACYSRAFGCSGGQTEKGEELSTFNIFRRNRAYDMTTSPHVFGENNAFYSNLISYTHNRENLDGELMSGKTPQPWGLEAARYSDHVHVNNLIINNTFYDVGGGIVVSDTSGAIDHSLYANNLIVNWNNENAKVPGGINDKTLGTIYLMNNGFCSGVNLDHIVVDDIPYTAADANEKIASCRGNLAGDPMFETADINVTGLYQRQEFNLSEQSPFRYAGLSLYDEVYKEYPVWELIKEDYTDVNGVPYLAECPSIGAYSFNKKITGDITSIGDLTDIYVRTGAAYERLDLPASVVVVANNELEVVLPITWSSEGFDSSADGTCTLKAQIHNGPHTDLAVEGKFATIKVNVRERLKVVSVITNIKDSGVTVPYGTSLDVLLTKMIDKIDVLTEGRFREDLPITWVIKDYNPYEPGVYSCQAVVADSLITNERELDLTTEVRVLHELGRGVEILVNPDFTDGTSLSPWQMGWGTGTIRLTTDPSLLPEGVEAGIIVTSQGKYGSLQQSVQEQLKILGYGRYLIRFQMRSYDPERPINSSYGCVLVQGITNSTYATFPIEHIGSDYVEFNRVVTIGGIQNSTDIFFHTSTGKTDEDVDDPPKSFIIASCSLIYLGTTDAEQEATLDSLDLEWNAIKGANTSKKQVMSNLELPTTFGTGSGVRWTSSNEDVIANDGTVKMGVVEQKVTLTANITYKGIETVKKFTVTVPRDPALAVYTGALMGDQTVSAGQEFKVKLTVNSANATIFNSYRFTLSFSTSSVEFVGIDDPGSTVEVDGGRLVISGSGKDRPIGDTITVTFRAKKSGITDIRLSQLAMDKTVVADLENLPVMTVTGNTATIKIEKAAEVSDAPAASADQSAVWIIVGVAAAVLIAGTVAAVILIKKKKRTPSAE